MKPLPTSNSQKDNSIILREVIRLMKIIVADKNEIMTDVLDPIEQKPINLHDATHLLIAKMPPIKMGNYQVTGVNGINIDTFHPTKELFQEEYSGILDEARVAIEQFCSTPCRPASLGRMIYYAGWLKKHDIDPVKALKDHIKVRQETFGAGFGEEINVNKQLGNVPANIISPNSAIINERKGENKSPHRQ